jgi:hypothetical protein
MNYNEEKTLKIAQTLTTMCEMLNIDCTVTNAPANFMSINSEIYNPNTPGMGPQSR